MATGEQSNDTVRRISWDEFRKYGFLRFVNLFLHIFGIALVLQVEDDGTTTAYPARVKYRGFPTEAMTLGYQQISKYMEENASELLKEAHE